MSTDKFNIHEMGTGNDTHSNFLRKMGYGDLLNRPGRQEITLDTASMYKKAADAGTMLTGAGAVSGGLAGNLLADYTDTGALGRLLMTVAGAGVGGVGGNILGKHLDTTLDNGMSLTQKNRHKINAAALGSLGALTGYGTSKYLMGSKNKMHNLLGALAGGAIGAGVGSHIADNKISDNVDKKILDIADDMGLKGDQRENFIRDYTAALSEEKSKGITDELPYTLIGDNPTEMDKVKAKYSGDAIPEERIIGANTWWKGPLAAEAVYAGFNALGGGGKILVGKKLTSNPIDYIANRASKYIGAPIRDKTTGRIGYVLPYVFNNKTVKRTANLLNSPKITNKAIKAILKVLSKGRI